MSQTNPRMESEYKGMKLALLIGAFFLVFIVGLLVGSISPWRIAIENRKDQTSADRTATAPTTAAQTTATQPPSTKYAATTADSEFKAIMEKRASATVDEYKQIAESMQAAGDKYPVDYRFPYEYAKLSVSGLGHHHAFGLLYQAGQRAIDAGKTDQLLADLDRDKDAEFYQCSRGHKEWDTLKEALKKKDKSALDIKMGGMHDME